MRTLTISISESDYTRFDLPGDALMFTDFVNVVSRELTRQNLNKSVELAEKYGLSAMTMDEITAEVNAVRRDAANRH